MSRSAKTPLHGRKNRKSNTKSYTFSGGSYGQQIENPTRNHKQPGHPGRIPFSNPSDLTKRNFWIGEDGHIHVKNLSAFWLPEFTLQKEIGGTVYTVTGSYDGTEPLNRKMERIMAEKFTEKMEDSE